MKLTPWALLLLLGMGGCATVLGAARGDDLGAIADGRTFARQACASCHAIGTRGTSPRLDAPPFGVIRSRHNALSLAREFEAIAEVDVQPHCEALRLKYERCPQEFDECSNHLAVRVAESQRISVLRAFGPIEHAPSHVIGLGLLRCEATFILRGTAPGSAQIGTAAASVRDCFRRLTMPPVLALLIFGQLNVSYPDADCAFRDSECLRDRSDGVSLTPELPGHLE